MRATYGVIKQEDNEGHRQYRKVRAGYVNDENGRAIPIFRLIKRKTGEMKSDKLAPRKCVNKSRKRKK